MGEGQTESAPTKMWSTWPGPPGCTCDMSGPAKNRCTKGGWIRCNGALQLQHKQLLYRTAVGEKGGEHPSAVVAVERP